MLIKQLLWSVLHPNQVKLMERDNKYYLITTGKVKEISKEQYQKMMDRNLSNQISPRLKEFGFDLSKYNPVSALSHQMSYHDEHKTGTFEERIIVKTKKFKNCLKRNKQGKYEGRLYMLCDLIGENTGKVHWDNFLLDFMLKDLDDDKYSQKYMELAICVSFSGIYKTPYDKFEFIKEFARLSNKEMPEYTHNCEQCEAKFKNVYDFVDHLIETEHNDCYLDEYPFFEPFKKINLTKTNDL